VKERRNHSLDLRDRARHHIGEVKRVAQAVKLLNAPLDEASVDDTMRTIGTLLNESHTSLRELYDVCTLQVGRLVEIIRADRQVYGARLMGGGFGGNVLVLTTAENVAALADRVQSEFYEPQNRDGVGEGAVMISTPGDGLSAVEL
jgi:galactokinase